MTIGEDRETERLCGLAVACRQSAERAQEVARERTIEYIDSALTAGWTWPRIGAGLGIGDRGAKNFYHRNRRRVHGGSLV
jgi:hypothetical protein